MDTHARRRRGWTISTIVRHLGENRRTIRACLTGEWTTGVRAPADRDAVEPFVEYRKVLRRRRGVGAA